MIEFMQTLSQAQDENADLDLLRSSIALESITGNETPFASFLLTELEKFGLKTGFGDFLEGRKNVWGHLAGKEGRPHLMFVGHTDTVHVRGWENYWQSDPRADPFAGVEFEEAVWGRGACDLKGGICAALASLRLLQSIGCELEGSITFAFVGDEESGETGTGVSAGIKAFVQQFETEKLPAPDFAIYLEPTTLNIFTAQIGFFIADLTVKGKTAYFGKPEQGVDALKYTHELLARIWSHETELRSGFSHDLVGPSSLLVTSIEGGGFIAVPELCRFSLIRTLHPDEDMDEAIEKFEACIFSSEGISVQVDYPAGRDHPKGGSASEIPQDTEQVLLLQDCIRQTSLKKGEIKGAPFWSEKSFLVNDFGCPAVYCAPGDISVAHTFEERICKDEYLASIRSFALFIAQYCGVKPLSNNSIQ
ncbi:MAG: M20 family metallopeptidase [Rhodobacteraceae bacterium]|nr:M20/M25/M40 family metallo-hydrolase [Paracoccaceae bacterium]MYG10601.1 M20 family metallopeptidase [Paracoccaceae bacterium]MYJ87290.1 M20 family metallopeptidase [Paracoccaceae bacterium]